MLCFDLQNRLCPDWERGVWHPGAGWCAVAGAFSLPLKRSVMHQGLGWRGDGGAIRAEGQCCGLGRWMGWRMWCGGLLVIMQGGAMAHAARCIGLRSVLRGPMQRAAFFCPCPVAWLEERIAALFSSFLINENCAMESTAQHFLLLVLWSCVFPLVGVSGASLRSLTGSRCFSPGRRHPFRRGIRWRGGNPVSARSGACCSSRCGLWSRVRGCLHPHRSG